jgi:hypothetical protein
MYGIGKYLFVLILLTFAVLPLESAYSVKSTCDFQHKECFTEAGYIACLKRVDVEKYYEFIDRGEAQLAKQLRDDPKRCKVLRANKKAFMVDKHSGFVKFGIRGENETYWAKREALFTRSK